MKVMPFTIGTIHFVGIGGIGMSGIAEIMHNLGYRIQGSDIAESATVRRLRALGIPIAHGHGAETIDDVAVLVVSSAIGEDNVEVIAARERHIPVVRRAEMLAELMRLKWSVAVAGTHGKTTTTSIIAAMLDSAELDPTVINGGIINAYGTNARLGAGDWMVVEADESDGSFVKLPAIAAVITNIDREHMEFYGDFDAVRWAYRAFVQNIPFYGVAALCIDHPEVQALIGRIEDRRIVTYGLSPQAEVRAVNVAGDPLGSTFDVVVSGYVHERHGAMEGVRLPMLGAHNVQNALAAIAVGREMGFSEAVIRRALADFRGVERRFTNVGVVGGVTVIDDYGHHPVEIAAVLSAARSAYKQRIVAVVQPHRYTRLRDLFEEFCSCFNDADTVVVADVHPAGEEPIEGIDREALVEGLWRHGHRHVLPLETPDALPALIDTLVEPGDLVVCLGAGSITHWARALPDALDDLGGGARAASPAGQPS